MSEYSQSNRTALSPYFLQSEFEIDAALPDECVPVFVQLCQSLLEPIRAKFGPIRVTSGYRTHESNEAAHGVPTSEHVATATVCAADWYIIGVNMRDVFDWVRNSPTLKWGQLILEHGTHNDIIHLSVNERMQRDALEGATANRTGYMRWPVAPPSLVQASTSATIPVETVSAPV